MNSSVVIHLVAHEKIDSENVTLFREELLAAASQLPSVLIVDMQRVERINSSCIGLLVLTSRLLTPRCRLVLCNLQPPVRHVIEITHLRNILDVAGTIEEARQIASNAAA